MKKAINFLNKPLYPIFNFLKIRKMILNDPTVINDNKLNSYLSVFIFVMFPTLITVLLEKAIKAIFKPFILELEVEDLMQQTLKQSQQLIDTLDNALNPSPFNFLKVSKETILTILAFAIMFSGAFVYRLIVKLNSSEAHLNEKNADKFYLYISTSVSFFLIITLTLLQIPKYLFQIITLQGFLSLGPINCCALLLVAAVFSLILFIYSIRVLIKAERLTRTQFALDRFKFSKFIATASYYLIPIFSIIVIVLLSKIILE